MEPRRVEHDFFDEQGRRWVGFGYPDLGHIDLTDPPVAPSPAYLALFAEQDLLVAPRERTD